MSLFKGYHSLFRYLGMIGAIFAIVQVLICIPLAITGFLLACIKPNIRISNPIGHAFCYLYFTNKTSVYDNYISPTFFLIIMICAIIIYSIWLVFSVILAKVYSRWSNENDINQITVRWLSITVAVCVFDFVIFLLFLLEFSMVLMDPDLIDELKKPNSVTKEQMADEFIKNQETIDFLLEEKNEIIRDLMVSYPDYTLIPEYEETDQEQNPFVLNRMNNSDKPKYNVDDDYGYISFHLSEQTSSFDFDKNYGVWSWFAAPPAIVMTVILKTYVGYVANLVILGAMYDFYINRDRNITTLAAPML